MSRRMIATDPLFVMDANGAEAPRSGDTTFANSRGVYRLAAATYYVPLGGQDAKFLSAMAQWDGEIVITSITVQETDAPSDLVSDFAAAAGNWFATDAARVTSAFNGAGTTTNTSDVIAHTGAGAGGSIQNIQDSGSRRQRLEVVVATPGEIRFFGWGQD